MTTYIFSNNTMAMNSEQRALKSETNGSQWRLDLCHSAQVQAIFE